MKRGFTLLELLVVVGIVAALIAVMTPSLGRARARARKVACGAVLHGLGIGIKAYLSEYNERFPYAAQMPSVNLDREALPLSLQSQVPAPRAWLCPADRIGYVRSDGRAFDSYFAGETLSYEYNMSLGGKRLEQDFLYPLVGPSGVFILADFETVHDERKTVRSKNLLFGDGHVGGIDGILARIGG